MSHILIAEDEPRISSFVSKGLIAAGYETTVVEDGADAVSAAMTGAFDLLLLDVGLPTLDGFDVLAHLRGHGSAMPIIMLTARTATHDIVDGFDGGVNDYIPKPFKFDELLARVGARVREGTNATPTTSIEYEDVRLDVIGRRATVAGKDIELSAREFALAEQFIRNPGKALTREQLLSRVWGLEFDPGSNVVDVYVRYLRGKFGSDRIETVRGTGYRWN